MTVIPTGGAVPGAAAPAATSTSGALGATLGGDAFLKLLVAQLKYQDPTKPVDTTAFMAQTAQLQMVETLHTLVDQNAALLSGQNTLGALSLVGQDISYTGKDGATVSGTVDAVKIEATGPVLVVGDTDVPLGSVTSVGKTPAATAPPSSGTTPTPSA